jgi:hypothetical protein
LDRLAANAVFMETLEASEPKDGRDWAYFSLARSAHLSSPSGIEPSDLRSCIERLSFESVLPDKTRYSESEWNQFLRAHILCPTERFYSPNEPTPNAGSSRHVLLRDLQIKGAGRNLLAQRLDWLHTSGKFPLVEAVSDYLSSHITANSLPFSALKSLAAGAYGKLAQGMSAQDAFSIRDASSLRVAQIRRKLSQPGSMAALNRIVENLGGTEAVLERALFQYASAVVYGLSQGSIIPENALLDARFIDTNLVTYSARKKSLLFVFLFKTPRKLENLKFGSLYEFGQALGPGTECTASNFFRYGQAIHDLWEALSLNSHFLGALPGFEDLKERWVGRIRELLELEHASTLPPEIADLIAVSVGKGQSEDPWHAHLETSRILRLFHSCRHRAQGIRAIYANEPGHSDNTLIMRFELAVGDVENMGDLRPMSVTGASLQLLKLLEATGPDAPHALLSFSSQANRSVNRSSTLRSFEPDLAKGRFVERSLAAQDLESYIRSECGLTEERLGSCLAEISDGHPSRLTRLDQIPKHPARGSTRVLQNVCLRPEDGGEYWFSLSPIRIR